MEQTRGCVASQLIVVREHALTTAFLQATEGPIVADKNCEKIHFISDNIRCAGAGTAADTEE